MRNQHSPHIREFELTPSECASALAAAVEAERRHDDCADPEFLDTSAYTQQMPVRLTRFLTDVRESPVTVAAILRGGWHPELDVLTTPTSWRHARGTTAGNVQNFLLTLYGSLLGEVFSWYGQQDGALVHDLVPTYTDRHEQLGSGSQTALSWHTEDAFNPHRADFVALYSVRAKDDARSTLSWLRHDVLSPESVATLREKKYAFTPDTSYSDHAAYVSEPVALLYGSADDPGLRADSVYYTPPAGKRERDAQVELHRALDAALVEVEMTSGDVLILNNRRVVHGRSAFQARYDGTDRWVKRINVTSGLERSCAYRCCSTSRMVHLAARSRIAAHSCDLSRTARRARR